MRDVILAMCFACWACVDTANQSPSDHAGSNTCTGELYDGCSSNAQCDSSLCKLYMNRGVQVCTQTCSATNPCPSQNGTAVVCNNMGLCRPDAPNSCEAP